MVVIDRRQQIIAFLRQRKQATVLELSRRFGVSEATIRRDLQQLDGGGLIQRVHGGALAIERSAPEPSVLQRMVENQDEKRAIGSTAAGLVKDGDTVFLGSGTTTLEVARALAQRQNLTIVTNALNIANVLTGNSEMTLIVLGGLLRQSELSLIGHITDQSLKELHTDKVIMGVRGISAQHGLTNDYLPETLTDRAIMALAPEIIVVADYTKLGRVSTAWVASISSIHTLVTDAGASPEQVRLLQQMGIQVIMA
jgi:DeoR/GlpR family transcriptional regulator of sugar metabolism